MLSGLSTNQTMHMLGGAAAFCRRLAIYLGLSNDRPRDNYHLCLLYVADTAAAAERGELLSGRSMQVSGERLKCILIL